MELEISKYLDSHMNATILGTSLPAPEHVEKSDSPEYAVFLYQTKQYSECKKMLKIINSNDSKWGMLACSIMSMDYSSAFEEILVLKEVIEQTADPTLARDQRAWLICWSLFVMFNDQKSDQLLDLAWQSLYLNAIQTCCPSVLKYIAAAIIISPKKQKSIKDFVAVIKQEKDSFVSDITDFVVALYDYDIDAIRNKFSGALKEIEQDYFLKSKKHSFESNSRLLILDNFCRVSEQLSFEFLAELMLQSPQETKEFTSNLIAKTELKLKITDSGIERIAAYQDIQQLLSAKLKPLETRTMALEAIITKSTQKIEAQ